ncbi:MAG TPA: Mur ligase domain-containing protein, partial [Devosia sp.]|nr:Mur ligase domain-containing protein [Devosia sp.]
MHPLWTVAEAVAATGGRPESLSDGPLASVSIDSREIGPEALFVAIKGDKLDGHDYVEAALKAGASAALVSEDWYASHPSEKVIVVPEPLEALRALGGAARARSKALIVAVTGSAGKTTTKEAIRTVLGAAGETHFSIKSFNNHWGVPLMLARLPR